MEHDEEKLKLMGEIAKDLQTGINESLSSIQRTMQIGVALLAAVFAAAFSRQQYGLLLVIPLPFGLLMAYQMQVYSDMMTTAWQRSVVVASIEKVLGSTFPPDIRFVRHGRANPSIGIANASYFVILGSTSLAGYWILAGLQPAWPFWPLYSLSVILSVSATAWAAWENKKSWDRCERAKDLLGKPYDVQMDSLLEELGTVGRGWRNVARFWRKIV